MKYIISESRLDNVIFKYLDSKLDGIELKKDIKNSIIFVFPGEEEGLMRWMGKKSRGQLLTYHEIVDEVETMFSMDESDALDVIGRYVESKYNLKVNKNQPIYFYKLMVVESKYNLKVNKNSKVWAMLGLVGRK